MFQNGPGKNCAKQYSLLELSLPLPVVSCNTPTCLIVNIPEKKEVEIFKHILSSVQYLFD